MRITKTLLAGAIIALSFGAAAGATDYSGGFCTHPKPANVSQSYYTKYCAVYGPNGSYSKSQNTTTGNTSGGSQGSTANYCYPNGSYWVRQRALYPDYYQQNNAYYQAKYGC